MQTIKHEVFGTIINNNSKYNEWLKELKLYFFGEERIVVLHIVGDDNNFGEFTELETLTYKKFFENLDSFLRKTETEVYEYYISVCDEYRDAIGDEDFLDEIAPIINSKEEINDLVSRINIFISNSYKNQRIVGIGMECTWEYEHGLGARFEDEEFIRVGYHYEAY